MKSAGTLNLKVPWGHIAAKTWGNKNESTRVLMIHGILDNAGTFDRLLAQLPQNLYYVCIDLPGHGLSSHFPPGIMLNYFSYLLSIRYVLDELQWEHAYYIGHSLGAHLGLLFTLVYPGRIQKLVLIDGIIAQPSANSDIIPRIRSEHDVVVKAYKLKDPLYYTKEEVMYALRNSRKCCLVSGAADALFERAVTKVDDDSYYYNRDFRARLSIIPIFSMDQALHLLRQIKVETLLIVVTDSLPFIQKIKDELFSVLKDFNYINIIQVKGNHDVHNNYPERISGNVSKFLSCIPSKL